MMYIKMLLLGSIILGTSSMLNAAVYFIDYENGKDTNKGTSAKSPWQHCPADEQATAKAAACTLQAGDSVLFKGGVRYRGSMTKPVVGQVSQPITFDGNRKNKYGKGRAIIDGSTALKNWRPCKSADEAGGNPHWKNIWYTEIKDPDSWKALNVLGAERPMPVAQSPNPSDPMFQERVGEFYKVKQKIKSSKGVMSFSDPQNLTQKDPKYFQDMTVCFHGGHNSAVYSKVTSYDPSTSTISMKSVRGKLYKETKYAFLNSVKLIDIKGEYALQSLGNGKARVFVMAAAKEPPSGISYSVREKGFGMKGASHVVIDGFLIERQGGKRAHGIYFSQGKDISIRHCEITMVRGGGVSCSHIDKLSFEDGFIHYLPGHSKGLVYHTCTDCHTIRTRFIKTTSTSLDYYNCHGGSVSQCEVSEHKGMHANGLTFYIGCRDLVIERNLVYDGNVNLTIQEAQNIIIRNNIFDGDGGMGVGLWTAVPFKNIQIVNNIIIDSNPKSNWATGLFSNNKKPEGLVVKNNIIDGLAGNLPGEFSHNIYTRLGPKQNKGKLGEGCLLVEDIKKILVDPDKRDYRLRPDSPAINAGIELGVVDDFDGKKRPNGVPDIGAYEFTK